MEETKKSKAIALQAVVKSVAGVTLLIGLFLGYLKHNEFQAQESCQQAEADADYIYAFVAEYISRPENQGVTTTQGEIKMMVDVQSPWTFTTCGDHFYLNVIDRSGKCPAEYQNQYQAWNSNVYNLEFKLYK